MNFVYFGSFRMSADILEGLVSSGLTPLAVVCSPDRPQGRKQIMTAPAVKQLIIERGWPIEILQPTSTLELEAISHKLKAFSCDLFIVMGYPKIIPKEIITLPRLGTVGVHPSLLPKYRGASPIQSALLAGEAETGVTLYCMDEKMDHGPVLASSEWLIANSVQNSELEKQLAEVAVKLLVETLPKFIAGRIEPKEQNHALATFTRKFRATDAQVDMTKDSAVIIYNKIRAFTPEPGVWTMNFPGREGVRVKLLEAELVDNELKISVIQPEGKKPLHFKQVDEKNNVL